MGCKLAENLPLQQLRTDLGLPVQCHSLRDDCVHSRAQSSGNYTMGIPGAVIGYCQALFNKEGDHASHTKRIIETLEVIDAPWKNSHELFWGNKNSLESVAEFMNQSMSPLLGEGRIPILITPLNPGKEADLAEIHNIFDTSPKVFDGETSLVRIVLDSKKSIDACVELINALIQNSFETLSMPKLWPLLQGNLSTEDWYYLKTKLKNNWSYINLAVNPFTIHQMPDFCMDQVTVGQVVIGHEEGVHSNGSISLPPDMKISGALEEDSYNLFSYFDQLIKLEVIPTLIILGPSLASWNWEYNRSRLTKLLPILRKACDLLWGELPSNRREFVWKLGA